jgi:hypothetical protein
MVQITQEIISMVDMLPEEEQNLAYEFIKRLVIAWDPDYTKTTPAERNAIRQGELEIENGEYYDDDEIDWDNLDKMDLD